MMKRRIWIMNHYASGMFFELGGRHYNFAKYLKRAGYEPVVFCCNAKHGKAENYFDTDELWHEHMTVDSVPFVFVRGRTYEKNGKQRVLNMVDFYRNVQKAAKEYAANHPKPDVIYASSVHPLTLVAGIHLAKKFSVKCIGEVRDLWPESIVAYSDRFTKKNLLIRLLYQGEKWIYKKCDRLIFTMEGGRDYITEQGWDLDHGGPIDLNKVHHINNGVDLEEFDYNREHFQTADADLDDPEIFKVIYTGSIRRVNNLGLILDAAKEVTDSRVKFLIWGDGDELPALRKRLVDEGIANVAFKGRVEKKYIPHIVSRGDLGYMHGSSGPLFRFGMSPNKLFDYFAAGKPVLMDFFCRYYNPVLQTGAGEMVEQPTTQAVAEKIIEFAAMDRETYGKFCENARKAAEDYDFKILTQKLISVMEGVAAQ